MEANKRQKIDQESSSDDEGGEIELDVADLTTQEMHEAALAESNPRIAQKLFEAALERMGKDTDEYLVCLRDFGSKCLIKHPLVQGLTLARDQKDMLEVCLFCFELLGFDEDDKESRKELKETLENLKGDDIMAAVKYGAVTCPKRMESCSFLEDLLEFIKRTKTKLPELEIYEAIIEFHISCRDGDPAAMKDALGKLVGSFGIEADISTDMEREMAKISHSDVLMVIGQGFISLSASEEDEDKSIVYYENGVSSLVHAFNLDPGTFSSYLETTKNCKNCWIRSSCPSDVTADGMAGKGIRVNSSLCRYDVVKECLYASGMKEVDFESNSWDLLWMDCGVSLERVIGLKPLQMINHFPGMAEICRKDRLAANIQRILRIAPSQYSFLPRSWILPNDLLSFQFHLKAHKDAYFIAKPDRGCQGKGIFVFQTMEEFEEFKASQDKKIHENYSKNDLVIQEYIDRPFALDGYKFDLRVYVFIKSMDPLEVYIHEEGLVRLATSKYQKPNKKNLQDSCMHLTNYAINKDSKTFVKDESGSKGSKRSLLSLWNRLDELGHNSRQIKEKINQVIVKTLLLAQPEIKNITSHKKSHEEESSTFRRCFEILGFDILLDQGLEPIVLEVNHSPSFTCDSKLDWNIKYKVISDALELMADDFAGIAQAGRKGRRSPLAHATDSIASGKKTGYIQAYPSNKPEVQALYDECQQKVLELTRDNKAVNQRNKFIKEKLDSWLKEEDWKAKHKQMNQKLFSNNKRGHIPSFEAKKVVPTPARRPERTLLSKLPLKLSITDLIVNFDSSF